MMVASAPTQGPRPTDLVDSGASAHFSPFIEDFTNGFTSSETITLQMANGDKVNTISQKGPVVIRYPEGNIILPEVHYVPTWTRRLLSEVRLLKSGYSFTGAMDRLKLITPSGATVHLSTANNVKEIARTCTPRNADVATVRTPLRAVPWTTPISASDPLLTMVSAYMILACAAPPGTASRTITQWHHSSDA